MPPPTTSDSCRPGCGRLRARHIDAVYETETAGLAGSPVACPCSRARSCPITWTSSWCSAETARCSRWPPASRQSGRDIPLLGVNFRSLGFLTETRIDELSATLDAAISGTAELDDHAMLSAEAFRAGERFDSRIVLNDVVFTKAALSRIIELVVSVSQRHGDAGQGRRPDRGERDPDRPYNLAAGGRSSILVDALVLRGFGRIRRIGGISASSPFLRRTPPKVNRIPFIRRTPPVTARIARRRDVARSVT